MHEKQTFEEMNAREICDCALQMKNEGYRLAQICCTKKEDFEIIYSFAKDSELRNIKVHLATDETIESVTGLFDYAYLYENEMKDLFGVKVEHINLDFKGTLYRTKVKEPFATREAPAKKKVLTPEEKAALVKAAAAKKAAKAKAEAEGKAPEAEAKAESKAAGAEAKVESKAAKAEAKVESKAAKAEAKAEEKADKENK